MRYKLLLLLLLLCYSHSPASAQNYFHYYAAMNRADSVYFVARQHKTALLQYQDILKKYDFVWLDDCMRLAQLAVVNDDKELGLFFLKKAIDNGLELRMIGTIGLGCICNFSKESREPTYSIINFVNANKTTLDRYYTVQRPQYLKRINAGIAAHINEDHVVDELYKVNYLDLPHNSTLLRTRFREKVRANFYYIDSLARKNVFVGERNTGNCSNVLMKDLGHGRYCIDSLSNYYRHKYKLAGDAAIPACTESDYFDAQPLFITYHHSISSGVDIVSFLTTHRDSLIGNGYMHPREYAYLYCLKNDTPKLLLEPSRFKNRIDAAVNVKRRQFFLPSLAIDNARHNYAHEHCIKLFFGFFNATR